MSEGRGTVQAIQGSFTDYSQIFSPLPCCHLSYLRPQCAKCASTFAPHFASCSLTLWGLVCSLSPAGHGYIIAKSPPDHVRLPETGAQCSSQWMFGLSLNAVPALDTDSLGGSFKPSTHSLHAFYTPSACPLHALYTPSTRHTRSLYRFPMRMHCLQESLLCAERPYISPPPDPATITLGKRGPGMVAHTCNPGLGRLGREKPRSEASLGYSAANSCLKSGAGSVVVLSHKNHQLTNNDTETC